ncbi:hypothetical protein M011DRAFT_478752 [Sporormia fimetaria CBS 119925]|uniref:DJ-1/PfpI domain-containing protein n=1 Tax=Sporormia fimetaria CBS 119925 TaxID=1340428 RepID=A0A6A6V4V0_9PLEO|nr:hypothetical protein M011DRAFT_478752 [Sporormia fimetaria CBS 119925]
MSSPPPRFPSSAEVFQLCTSPSPSPQDIRVIPFSPSKRSLKIGILVLSRAQVQLFDLAAIDLLPMLSRTRIDRLTASSAVIAAAVDEVDIRYISESGEGSFPITSGARIPVTNSFDNAPQMDVLIIPGSFSYEELTLAATTFMREQSSNRGFIALLSMGSGILSLAQTGLLHETRAATSQALFPFLQQRFPETRWRVMHWTKQGHLWTSSSAVAGIVMLVAWVREYFWDRREAVECVLGAAGFPPLHNS